MKRLNATIIGAFAGAIVGLGATTVMAKDAPGTGPNPYTDCGIGAALFPNTDWAAVTSNIIWDIGTTAIISATASPETCEGESAQAAKFIYDAYDNVLEDTARGDGEYIVALLQIYGCSSAKHEEIIDAIRTDIADTVGQDDYAEMPRIEKAESYFKVIDAEIRNDFSASCAA